MSEIFVDPSTEAVEGRKIDDMRIIGALAVGCADVASWYLINSRSFNNVALGVAGLATVQSIGPAFRQLFHLGRWERAIPDVQQQESGM